MLYDDTIAAISTPLGYSGIGIVRLSGNDSIGITDKIFVSPKKKILKQMPSHRIVYGYIINSKEEIIEEVLVSVMRAPYTYTREDIVEINCHGGLVSLRRILELVLKNGARLAEPGEFTKRAFLNGRIDLAQAEAVLDVISALTEQGQKAAIEQLRGGISEKIETVREKLIELTAFVEAHIDFPDDDIETVSLKDMKRKALNIQRFLRQLLDSSQYGMILREGLRTAIIGRPNVGKSSLLNALLQNDMAIVTEVPGTTRDVIEGYLNIQGLPIKIIDTAGIREVEDVAEKEGVKRSLRAMQEADLVLIVFDGSEDLHDTDRELIGKSSPRNTVLVINKIDLKQRIKLSEIHTEKKTDRQVVRVSAVEGIGLNELKDKIVETALKGKTVRGVGDSYRTGIVTNIRHVQALERVLTSVDSFIDGIIKKTPHEYLAVELREALDAIGEILGITTPEDILNKIFSNFCIGK